MKDICTADGKNPMTTKFPTTETLAPTYILSALQAELANLDSIYTSYKPLILTVSQLLRREPFFDGTSPFNKCTKISLLPFLGDALEQQQLRMSEVSRTESTN